MIAAQLSHWQIPVDDVSRWVEMELPPGQVLPGDLWLDPHGDTLRGVIDYVEVAETFDGYEVFLRGFTSPWRFGSNRLVRVVRLLAADDWRRI